MPFSSLIESEFYRRLYTVVRPSQPIDASEFLFGRDHQYSDMKTSIFAPGRHSFIYGSRGVGKSSLAHSVAYDFQEQTDPILLSCEPSSTMISIVSDAIREASIKGKNKSEWTVTGSISVGGTGVKFEKKGSSDPVDINIVDTSSAVYALEYLQKIHSDMPFLVVDEFDRIEDVKEREKFGTLLKQLGDKKCNVKFIFTGIAESFQELLSGHASSSRQIHELKLGPLSWDGRYAIVDRAFSEFGLIVPDDIRFRIAGLSDGYPHYIHLICEKMLGLAYENNTTKIDYSIFISGLDRAVRSVAQALRGPYEKATAARDIQFSYILWAVADSADLQRKKTDILQSYESVIKQIKKDTVSAGAFSRMLSSLKNEDFGVVVIPAFGGKRKGWYRFNENMLRGYVRMCAEVNKIKLDFETNFTSNEPTAQVRINTRGKKTMSQVESDYERELNEAKEKLRLNNQSPDKN
ncbi:AAA family ATPase [Yersinia enterocolitica]|uniref:AAA family ATPase n=1 Tax=Yersinia alsatica TaxID=2890317 RepID=UPI0011A73873|nr:AAA family ATPase [Yersinia alsatica]